MQELQASFSVFIVTRDNQAEFRKVELGPRVGLFFVVRSGLRAGDNVVIEGIQKLQNSVPVSATMTHQAATALAPINPDSAS